MREILFRGKAKKGELYEGKWIEGGFLWWNGKPCIFYNAIHIEVIPETVGQYTGLTDMNGKKIIEGVICRVTRHCILCYGSITFKKGSFWFDEFNTDSVLELSKLEINNFEIKIIGNIHDNPELLKECEGEMNGKFCFACEHSNENRTNISGEIRCEKLHKYVNPKHRCEIYASKSMKELLKKLRDGDNNG